jgi:hypothetical protein
LDEEGLGAGLRRAGRRERGREREREREERAGGQERRRAGEREREKERREGGGEGEGKRVGEADGGGQGNGSWARGGRENGPGGGGLRGVLARERDTLGVFDPPLWRLRFVSVYVYVGGCACVSACVRACVFLLSVKKRLTQTECILHAQITGVLLKACEDGDWSRRGLSDFDIHKYVVCMVHLIYL